jgi:PAS domain S-box-containing protein
MNPFIYHCCRKIVAPAPVAHGLTVGTAHWNWQRRDRSIMMTNQHLPGGERWVESDRRLRAVYDGVALGIVVVDLSDRILDGNRAFHHLLGYRAGDLRLRRFDDLVHAADAPAHRTLIDDLLAARHDTFAGEARLLRGDGTVVWARLTSSLVHGSSQTTRYRVTTVEDISARVAHDANAKAERDAADEQLLHAQRMEIVGRLAGTIAHDFSNQLTVVRSNAELILRGLGGEPRDAFDVLTRQANEIRASADRASALTRQLQAFCRRQAPMPQTVDVNEVVRDMQPWLARLVGEDVSIELRLRPAPSNIRVDVTRLQQIVLNIAVNAREAMPRGGTFIVETAQESNAPGARDDEPQPRAPGAWIRLSLGHSGASIPEDVQPQLFDPLLDAASRGDGARLGLATIRKILADAGGLIRLRSSLGHGATFDVYLPERANRPSAQVRPHLEGEAASAWSGTETVLLVEDDDAVRAVARRSLGDAGYTVLEARNGREAIRLAEQFDGEIHVIVADVVMPGMSGPTCVDRIMTTRPNVPAVYLSGYADDIVEGHGVVDRVSRFVRKPFTPSELARAIRLVLD